LVQVDLLVAELEREALLGRRAKALELHAERLGVKADARREIARGQDDVVDVVDHQMIRFSLSREISSRPTPMEARISSVCSPSSGAGLRTARGVPKSCGITPGPLSRSPPPATMSWIMPRAA